MAVSDGQLLDLYMSRAFDAHWSNAPGMPFVARFADNVPILTAYVDEGREVVERSASLLRDMGLSLKDHLSEDKYLVNLNEGGTTELLGFAVSTSDGTLRYDVTPTALDTLRDRLHQAHETDNPPAAAKAVIGGWLTAVGPAFSRSRDDVLDGVLTTARRMGFKEFSREHLRQT